MNKKQKKLVIALIIAWVMVFPQTTFAETWADKHFNYAEKNGLLPTELKQEEVKEKLQSAITREEFISCIVFGLGEDVTKEDVAPLPFIDKDQVNIPLQPYIAAAYRLEILAGIPGPEGLMLLPKQSITREEAATLIGRSLGMSIEEQSGFGDDEKVAPWAKSYVTGMEKGAVILGNDKNEFAPLERFTWGEMMSVMQYAHEAGKFTVPQIRVLAGNGEPTYLNGITTKSGVHGPMGLTRDGMGRIYFVDNGNNLIRNILNGVVSDYAGLMSPKDNHQMAIGGYSDDDCLKSLFYRPTDIQAVEDGVLVTDSGNNLIRLVKSDKVYTYAGEMKAGYLDGGRKTALFRNPTALTADADGNVYISDTGNHVIRKMDKSGIVTTIAGVPETSGFLDGDAKTSLLCEPSGLTYYEGGLYIADSGNQRIRLLKDGIISTIAGGGMEKFEETNDYIGDYADGDGVNARFNNPKDLTMDKNGNLYITDMDNGMIRKYKDGKVTTLLGASKPINFKGTQIDTYLVEPYGILALNKELIFTDAFTNYVLSIPLKDEEA